MILFNNLNKKKFSVVNFRTMFHLRQSRTCSSLFGNFSNNLILTFKNSFNPLIISHNKEFFKQEFVKKYLNSIYSREVIINNLMKFKKIPLSGLTLFSNAKMIKIKQDFEIIKGMLFLVYKQVVGQYNVSFKNLLDLVEKGLKKSLEELDENLLPKNFVDFLLSNKRIAACQKAIYIALTIRYKFPKPMVKQLIEKKFNIDLQALPENIDGTSLREIYTTSLILNKANAKVEAFMINPKNILVTPGFTVEKSEVDTGQPHADVMLKVPAIKLYDEKFFSNRPTGRIVMLFYFLKRLQKYAENINTKSFIDKEVTENTIISILEKQDRIIQYQKQKGVNNNIVQALKTITEDTLNTLWKKH